MRFEPPCGVVPPVAKTPTKALRTSLFWMVMLEKTPALPRTVASEMTTAELVLAPLITTQFFSVSLVTGVAPTDPNEDDARSA